MTPGSRRANANGTSSCSSLLLVDGECPAGISPDECISTTEEEDDEQLKRHLIRAGCQQVGMGNSALKSHLETAQKTGVFQLTGKGLQEVRRTWVIRPLGANPLFSTNSGP